MIKVNKSFSYFVAGFLKEIENMFCVFLSIYKNNTIDIFYFSFCYFRLLKESSYFEGAFSSIVKTIRWQIND